MSLQPFIDKFFSNGAARDMANAVRSCASECESVLEFGTRGGVSATLLFQALLDRRSKWRPSFVGIDLIRDESVSNLAKLAAANNISFSFWQGHSKQYPAHEVDAFCWDTFHCGGNLLEDLNRIGPFVNKYIFILGTGVHGVESEAVRRKLDMAQVAKELHISEEGAKMGLSEAISKFLHNNSYWAKVKEVGQITILKRTQPPKQRIFAADCLKN